MPAYVVSEVEVIEPELFRRYRELAAASIGAHGGRYLARGAEPDVVEGEPLPGRRIVIVEFPDRESLYRWYRSAEYAEALSVRDRALRRRLFFVDGVPEPAGDPR
ncbi:DUF1330 domain-containing protein [Micromonospora sp. R77]|uniref:DUF1330 domain-containing protein n=1 Tax=Micromonospora sp. R77 TaxID=2925836 RepID=UPI001F617F78|nr:DUF1330 domain-containing protein [Micromonospora sp. R77]MCI4066210.1 DUF1330 domain-containing protein [Micromonospora sp. R77]